MSDPVLLTEEEKALLWEEIDAGNIPEEELDGILDMIEFGYFDSSETPTVQTGAVLTSPLPTGIREVDQAGEVVVSGQTGGSGRLLYEQLPPLESYAPEHEYSRRKARADQGVDMQFELPFFDRANIERAPNYQSRRAEYIKATLKPHFDRVPEGYPKFRYDPLLDEFQFLREQPDEPGKFRWTSMDGTGLSIDDLGNLADAGELGSLAIGFMGAGAAGRRIVAFGSNRLGAAGGATLGGFEGRFLGDSLELAMDYISTGYVPTKQELMELGYTSLEVETLAASLGELGSMILRTGSDVAQEAFAFARNKQAVKVDDPRENDLDVLNKNLRQTQEDMAEVGRVLGRPDAVTVSRGTATHSIDMIEAEGHARVNASKKTQRAFNRAQARAKRGTEDYINAVWGTPKGYDKPAGEVFGKITEINDAIYGTGVIVARNEEGLLYFGPKAADNISKNGEAPPLGLYVNHAATPDMWQVRQASLNYGDANLSDMGIGTRLYEAAANEAMSYGKAFGSDDRISGAAMATWRSYFRKADAKAADPETGPWLFPDGRKATIDPRAEFNQFTDSTGKTVSEWRMPEDALGEPVVRIEPPPSISETYLTRYSETAPTASGRLAKAPELKRLVSNPTRMEMAQISAEVERNPFVRQDWKEVLLDDYDDFVLIEGKSGNQVISPKKLSEWLESRAPMLETVFSPEEIALIRTPFSKNLSGAPTTGIRAVTERSRGQAEISERQIQKALYGDDVLFLRDTGRGREKWGGFKDNNKLFMQWRNIPDRRRRQRAMRVLDSHGLGDSMRAQMMNEIRLDLLQKTSGANSVGYDKWLKDSKPVIMDVMGEQFGSQYARSLEIVGHILKRRRDRNMVRSVSADANPSALALTRVIFGPLSRAQRFFTAARRAQVRSSSAVVGDLINDPSLLRELVAIREYDIASRRVSRFLQDSGMVNLWLTDGETFDADSPEDRQMIAERIIANYHTEMIEQEEYDANVE